MQNLCKFMNIEQQFSTAYRHQTIGTVERNHRVLNEYLRSYASIMDEWEEQLKLFTFCYNISTHTSLGNKYTPYELIFAKKCNMPIDLINGTVDPLYDFEDFAKESKFRFQKIHNIAQKLIEKSKINNKKQYDRNSENTSYEKDDLVLLKNEPYNKFKNIYSGPHKIISVKDSNVEIFDEKNNKRLIVHKDRLRKTNMHDTE